jgi:uncharacterized protein YraI
MRSRPRLSLLGFLLAGVAGVALAQNAVTARPVNVHAGPDQSYPLVAHLDPGAPVLVNGCLDDWSWCDVSFGDDHGWVYAPTISYDYRGGYVPLYDYAPTLGIPVVVFSVGPYWDHYYRARPWYSQRATWVDGSPPPHMRPAAPPHQGPPPNGIHTAQSGNAAPYVDGHAGRAAERPAHEAPAEHAPAPHTSAPHAAHGPSEARPNEARSEPHGSATHEESQHREAPQQAKEHGHAAEEHRDENPH